MDPILHAHLLVWPCSFKKTTQHSQDWDQEQNQNHGQNQIKNLLTGRPAPMLDR